MTPKPDEALVRRVNLIMDRGLALLDGGRPLAAWRAGRRLCRFRYSGGYELRGRALAALGKMRLGRLVMERGVSRVPGASMMWMQVGIISSDMGDYDLALEAFDRGLAVEGEVDVAYMLLNKAVVYQRLDRQREVLDTLDLIPTSELNDRERLAEQVAALRKDAEDEIRPSAGFWRKLFFWRRR